MINCVYRFLNEAGEIIYVGKAKHLKHRLSAHTHLAEECYEERQRIEYVCFETEDDMEFAERYYISKYKPKFNVSLAEKEITINSLELNNKIWMVLEEEEELMTEKTRRVMMRYLEKQMKETQRLVELERSKEGVYKELLALMDKDSEGYRVAVKSSRLQRKKVKESQQLLTRIQEQMLRYEVGDGKYEEVPDWLKRLYAQYGYLSRTQLIEAKLSELKMFYLNQCVEELKRQGYYQPLALYRSIDEEFRFHALDESKLWLNLFEADVEQTNKINKAQKDRFVSRLIQEIERELILMFGGLNQDVLMVKPRPSIGDWEDAMVFEQPVLINRVSQKERLDWV